MKFNVYYCFFLIFHKLFREQRLLMKTINNSIKSQTDEKNQLVEMQQTNFSILRHCIRCWLVIITIIMIMIMISGSEYRLRYLQWKTVSL